MKDDPEVAGVRKCGKIRKEDSAGQFLRTGRRFRLEHVLQGDLHNYILGIMAIAAQCYFTLLAHRLYTAGLATLVARAEKDALIAELEQAKMNSD
mgnify:CR=1 FL=1